MCRDVEQKVELVNERELLTLVRDFEFETPLFGFFFKDGEGHRIDMFPGFCRHCQESEVGESGAIECSTMGTCAS